MYIVIASLPMLCYGFALVLGFFRIELHFASAELSRSFSGCYSLRLAY